METFQWHEINFQATPQRLLQIICIAHDYAKDGQLPQYGQLLTLALSLFSRTLYHFNISHGRDWLDDDKGVVSFKLFLLISERDIF